MALWAKVQQLDKAAMKQLQSAYGVYFPIEVRHYFADWIEQQAWMRLEEGNPEHERFAAQLLDQLTHKLQDKANELSTEDNFLEKLRLQETLQQFREIYGAQPMTLVTVVKRCLTEEEELVNKMEFVDHKDPSLTTSNAHIINQKLMQLTDFNKEIYGAQPMTLVTVVKRCLTEEEELVNKMEFDMETEHRQSQELQEFFVLKFGEKTKVDAQLQQMAGMPNGQYNVEDEKRLKVFKQQCDSILGQKGRELLSSRTRAIERFQMTLSVIKEAESLIVDQELMQWKRQQQAAHNGALFNESFIDTIQQWCESLADLIWTVHQQIKRLIQLKSMLPLSPDNTQQTIMQNLATTVMEHINYLLSSTFVIDKQPPQVLKKDSRFSTGVRSLIGGKLGLHMNPPSVRASIVSEELARQIYANNPAALKESSGDLLNNISTMEYNPSNRHFFVSFRNMTLRKIRRTEKRGNEVVTEEKFAILFQCELKLGDGEMNFTAFSLSIPVVVTVHGNQECNALATILWDNAFAEPGRKHFHVPEQVLWPKLADALTTKFASHCSMNLSMGNLHYLASKLFGNAEDYSNHYVSWSQFNREQLQGRAFTFWEWFYAILKLTKEFLIGPWKQGLIHGFISKHEAQEKLQRAPMGNFMLRFSDSELGGITIAWVAEDPNTREAQVWNLEPFKEKDLRILGLGDRIKDLHNLVFLYPNRPKIAFKEFWNENPSANTAASDGYVKAGLTATIKSPPFSNPPTAVQGLYEDPRSPHLMRAQSPMTDPPSVPPTMQQDNMPMIQDDFPDHFPDQFMTTDYGTEDISQINIQELLCFSQGEMATDQQLTNM